MLDTFTSKAVAAADYIPYDVAAYLRHEVNNKLHPIVQTLEILSRDARESHICGLAIKSAEDLESAIRSLTEIAIKKGDTNVQSNPA